MTKASQ